MNPIKRLNDLTHAELLAIVYDSEDYNNLIDLECAHRGISLLPPYPGLEPSKTAAKPDTQLFKVGNWGFATVDVANEVINFMVSKGIWKEESQSGVNVMMPLEENSYYYPEIKKALVYTQTAYDQIKDEVDKQATLYKEWKENNDVYSAIWKERKEVIKDFNSQRDYATELKNNMIKTHNSLQRYLVLSQGSYPIAVSFLKEADKLGDLRVDENDSVFYKCTRRQEHLIATRETHQQNCMSDLLGVDSLT
jgi:hypothetical protein